MTEIKPCPFCGNEELDISEIYNNAVWWDSKLRYESCLCIACECGCSLKGNIANHGISYEKDRAELIKRWNRRIEG